MQWTRGPVIGRGSSATVYLATAIFPGNPFAVKSAALSSSSSSSSLLSEHSLLSSLTSPHIVKSLGFDITTPNSNPIFNLFMEYAAGGSLRDEIRRRGGRLEEPTIRSYTRQILLGLDYLHANGLAHCDIKSRNILLAEDGLKIADFGCAKRVDCNGVAGKAAVSGSPAFMAPEVARGERQGLPADVWAVGCTVIEMATGNHPWPEMEDPAAVLYRVGFSGESPEIPKWLSAPARDFVEKCLKSNAGERWTAGELLEHPFVQRSANELGKKKDSPSCVLDRRLWESPENAEADRSCSWMDSAAERIKKLTKKSFFSGSEGFDIWDLDLGSDWVTVWSVEFAASVEEEEEEEEEERESVEREEEDFGLETVKFERLNEYSSHSLLAIIFFLFFLIFFINFLNKINELS